MVGVAALLLTNLGSPFAQPFGDMATLAAALLATGACVCAARRLGQDRRSWTLLAVAFAIWSAGQGVWTADGFTSGQVFGRGTPADIGFLGALVPTVAALVFFRRDSSPMLGWVRGWVDAMVIATSVLFSSWVVALGPSARVSTGTSLNWALGQAYPLLDAFVAALVLFLVMRQPAGSRLPWALLASGLVVLTATDTSYLAAVATRPSDENFPLFNIGWVLAMMLAALAALAPSQPTTAGWVRYLGPAQELVPFLPVGIAVYSAARVDVFSDPFLVWDGLAVLILVGIRQVMIVARKEALAHSLEERVQVRTAELSHAQDDLRQAFDNGVIGIIWFTLSGVIVQANAVFCAMLGRSCEVLVGTRGELLMYPADLAVAFETLADAGPDANFPMSRAERRYRHQDGREVWAEVSMFVTRDLLGEPKFLVAQVQDITERREAARAKANQSTFLQAVLENLDDGVVACDSAGTLTLVNRSLRELSGPTLQLADPATWAAHIKVFGGGGVVPLLPSELPLFRALAGEHVRNVEMVLASWTGERRTLIANGHSIRDVEGDLLGAVIAMNDVTERRAAEAALTRQALHDPLTDLANRALLRDRLEHSIARQARKPEPLALLLLDLDGFKLVNDSLGHAAGDEVLTTLANRFRACLRADDTIARLGGDEFAVVLENTSEHDAIGIADQILSEIRRPILVQGRSISSDASVGIMISTGGDSPESLLRNADLAMYAAKDSGQGNVEVFKASMHAVVLERLTLEAELREALRLHKLTLAYQPIVSLLTNRLQGFEALARWNHPVRGIIEPATFIPVAESSGLIVPLGEWVLREACRQASRWRLTIPGADDLTMAVNLSVRQLHDPKIAEVVADALAAASLPAELLQLEVTETIFERRGQLVIDILNRLHATGVRLVIDDFGTGYSSLSRLHSLPIDTVKIDKSFIDLLSGGGTAPMVAATIAMAHSLGMRAVAEGVETADQVPFLLLHGCDDAQGYLLGRPQPAAETSWLLHQDLGRMWLPDPRPVDAGSG